MSHHNIVDPIKGENRLANRAAPGVSYYTPLQDPPAGTGYEVDGKLPPKLFQPIKIRNITLPNRIMLSPLCQYSSHDGHMTNWQLTHLGGILQRGPGITCTEATAVTANGRITPEDAGIWKDSQVPKLKEIVEFAHSQNQKIMIQLAHAGRKASTAAPWLSSGDVVGPELNGWPDNVWAPSAIAWNDSHAQPKEMTAADIEEFKSAYKAAVKRAVDAGFDAIEIHAAHGYLLTSFLSPVSNKRTDKYGGSWENRVRLVLETVDLVRETIPKDMPLWLRISATEWLEEKKDEFPESWTNEDTIKLAPLLAEHGVDVLDVSSGGNHPAQHPHVKNSYQAPFAKAIKEKVGDKLLVGTVGGVPNGPEANQHIEDGLDIVAVGRGFQKNPGLVFTWADELGTEAQMPNQIRWGFAGRGKKTNRTALEVLQESGKLQTHN